jgi:hypothetical protein
MLHTRKQATNKAALNQILIARRYFFRILIQSLKMNNDLHANSVRIILINPRSTKQESLLQNRKI